MQELTIICNGKAGRYDENRLNKAIEALSKKYKVHVQYPVSIRQTKFCVKQCKSPYIVVAGGDGTINNVISALTEKKEPNILGILPFGTANVLCHEVGINNSMKKSIDAILKAKTKVMSLGLASDGKNERIITCMAGAGFDSTVVKNLNKRLKNKIGKLAYAWECLKIILKKPSYVHAEIKGKRYTGTQITVFNGQHYGGNFLIAPHTDITKENFEVIINNTRSLFSLFFELIKIKIVRGSKFKNTKIIKCKELSVYNDEERILLQVDGDDAFNLPCKISLHDKKLKIICA